MTTLRSARRATLAAAAAVLATGAMGPTDCSQNCPTSVQPAVVLHVVDAATSAPLAAGTTATLTRLGAPVGSFDGGNAANGYLVNSSAPPGTYRLTVTHAGYADFVRDGVVVRRTSGDCPTIQTVRVEAALVAAAAP